MPGKTKSPENNQGPKTTNQYTAIAPEGVTYLTVEEFASRFNLAASSVRRHCANGNIPGAIKFDRLWRIPVKEKELWN